VFAIREKKLSGRLKRKKKSKQDRGRARFATLSNSHSGGAVTSVENVGVIKLGMKMWG